MLQFLRWEVLEAAKEASVAPQDWVQRLKQSEAFAFVTIYLFTL